jgi:transcriptional regulator with XRE-family HTH domain
MTPTTPTPAPTVTPSDHSNPSQSGTADHPRASHVGDLARRITHRRNELGFSTEELARRAGVDAWFLAYFEQSADTTLTAGALLRLAAALQTTAFALEGGQVDRSPGEGRAGLRPVLENLTPEQCEAHLAAGGIGRIVLSTGSGPVAFPVNFVFSKGAVTFRTSDAMAGRIKGIVAFEVDHIDEAMSGGWSVLVRGYARLVEDLDERDVAGLLDIDPWAGGARLNLVEVAPFELTGRVITQRQSA